MSVKNINKHIKILDDEVIQITVKFAENNLSKACLSSCDYKNDKYYEWTLGSSAYCVFFDLPKLFNVYLQEIYKYTCFYCPDYINKMNINPSNFRDKYRENYNKNIIYKDS